MSNESTSRNDNTSSNIEKSVYEGVGFPDGTERSLHLAYDGLYCSKAEGKEELELICFWDRIVSHKANKENQRTPKLWLQLMIPDEFDEDQETELQLQLQNRDDLNRIKIEISKCLRQALEEDRSNKGGVPGTTMMDDSLQWQDEPLVDKSCESHTSTTAGDESMERNPPEPLIENEDEEPAFDEAAQVDAAIVLADAAPIPPGGNHQDDLEMQTLLRQGDTAPTDDPTMWAITYQQLMDLEGLALEALGKKRLAKATMRDINRVIIQPTCQRTGRSYALTHNPNGLLLDAFVTHAWDEPFQDFVESIRHVFHTTMHKPNLWICACALFQGDSKQIAAQVGTSLEDSAFVRALKEASMYVVVRNSATDLYSRIWCIAELIQSKKMGLIPDRAFVTGSDDFSSLKTSCLDAQAFNPKDRDSILKVLLTEHNREEIDNFVHQFRAFEPPRRKQDGLVLGMSPLVVGMCLIALVVIIVVIAVSVVVSGGIGGRRPTQFPTPSPSSFFPSSTPSNEHPETVDAIPSNLLPIIVEGPTSVPNTVPPTKAPITRGSEEYNIFNHTNNGTTIETESSTLVPTALPLPNSSIKPSIQPSSRPTLVSTPVPFFVPSTSPSYGPSKQPTVSPSNLPSMLPSSYPSRQPSHAPSSNPGACPKGSIIESGLAVEGAISDPESLGYSVEEVDKITQLRVWSGTYYGVFGVKHTVVGKWQTTYRFKDGNEETFSAGKADGGGLAQETINIDKDHYLSKVLWHSGAAIDYLQFCTVDRNGEGEECSVRTGGDTSNPPQSSYSMEGQQIISFGTKETETYIDPNVGVYFREIGKC